MNTFIDWIPLRIPTFSWDKTLYTTPAIIDIMSVGTVDEKWRLQIPKEVRRVMRLTPRTTVDIRLSKNSLIIKPLRKTTSRHKFDSLTWLLKHPAHADPVKVKAIDLEKIEEEMWSP